MKKILVIVGSARKGSSLTIGNFANSVLRESDSVSAEIIRLADYRIDYCDGLMPYGMWWRIWG